MSSMAFEVSTENVDVLLESDDLLVEVSENAVELLTVQNYDAFELLVEGPQGPQGPAGGGTYTHTQSTPAATWTISHGLNAHPAVVLMVDSAPGELVMSDVTYPDTNTVVVTWNSPESGKAYLR